MTVATNALLEDRTARTALIATDGFTDVIELGRQGRADLYRALPRPARLPWCPRELRFAAPERTGPDGPLRELDPAGARALIEHDRRASARRRSPSRSFTPTPIPRTSACSASSSPSCCQTSTSPCPASWSAPSASTSARPPRCSTRRSRRCSRPTCAASSTDAAARGLPEPLIMQSSGGLTDCGPRRRPRRAHRPLRPRRRRRRGAAAGAARRRARRALLRHGRHILRRVPDRRLRGRRDRRAHDRRTAAVAARARHPHRRRRRRLDRLARSRRRPARGAGLGGRGTRTGLLRPRRPSADGHRRQPPARPPARGLAARGRARARPRGRRAGRSPASRRSSAWTCLACAAGHRARGRGRDAGRAARDDRRARDRSARLRADAVRRGGAPARRRPGARARHRAHPLPARLRRALRPRSRRRRSPPRRLAHGHAPRATRSPPSALSSERDALIAEARAELAAPPARLRVAPRAALPRPVLRAGDRADRVGGSGRACARRSRARTSTATATATTRPTSSWSTSACPSGAARPRLRRWPPPARRPLPRPAPIVLRRRAARGDRPPRRAAARHARLAGPALCALPEATLLIPPGWCGEVDAHGTIHLQRAPERCLTRSSCRSSPAPCAPPARRWASC